MGAFMAKILVKVNSLSYTIGEEFLNNIKDVNIIDQPNLIISLFCQKIGVSPDDLTDDDKKTIYNAVFDLMLNRDSTIEITPLKHTLQENEITPSEVIRIKELIEKNENNAIWVEYEDFKQLESLISVLKKTKNLSIFEWDKYKGLNRVYSSEDTEIKSYGCTKEEELLNKIEKLKDAIIILHDFDVPIGGKDIRVERQMSLMQRLRDLIKEKIKKNKLHIIILSAPDKFSERLTGLFTVLKIKAANISMLNEYCKNLNQETFKEDSELVGRNEELKRLINILKRQDGPNNVLLVGKAGVGKTFLVRELAKKIAEGEIQDQFFSGKVIFELDINSFFATGGIKGEREKRIKELMHIVKHNSNTVIIFIDEIHRLFTNNDYRAFVESLLPLLNQGKFPLIGATTEDNLKPLEDNTAFMRRMSIMHINELPDTETTTILKNLREKDSVPLKDDQIKLIVKYSKDYITNIVLPSSAIKVYNTLRAMEKKDYSKEDIIKAIEKEGGVVIDWKDRLAGFEEKMNKLIIGQKDAIKKIYDTLFDKLVTYKERAPVVMCFMGPTGVGKTQTSQYIAEVLFGNQEHFVLFNMAQYHDEASINTLIGSPPGYVGSQRGGALTNWLRDHKSGIVTFDEIEKAHPGFYKPLLRLFNDGKIEDASGKIYDGSNSIYIMTSNLGSNLTGTPDEKSLRNMLISKLPPEFVGRINKVIWFRQLEKKDIIEIVKITAVQLLEKIKNSLDKNLLLDDDVYEYLTEILADESRFGVRGIKNRLGELLGEIARKYLESDSNEIKVSIKNNKIYVNGEEFTPHQFHH